MLIDIKEAALRLSELWWQEVYLKEHETKEIYDVYLYEGHGIHAIEEVKTEHANVFWNRVTFYEELLQDYEITKKKRTD